MSTPRPLSGVLPVVQTPFTPDGAIDDADLRREIDWVLDQGVAGITTGMVSEILRLDGPERSELAEIVCEEAQARGALSVISCGTESTHGAVAQTRHAAACGADAVMVNPPISVRLDDDMLFAHYAAIVEATDLPVVVQDASGYVGIPLSIDVQVRLLAEFGDRVYFKPEAAPIGPRLSMLREATDGKARVLEGTGGSALIDSYRRGIVGTMPGSEVCWAIQRMWDAVEAGDFETAYAFSGPLAALISLQTAIDVFVAVEKHLLVRQGVLDSPAARGPLGFTLDGETRAEVDRLFDLLVCAAGQR